LFQEQCESILNKTDELVQKSHRNIFESINNNNQMSVQTIAALPESNPYKSLDKKDY